MESQDRSISQEAIDRCADLPVLDADGRPKPFKSLYTDSKNERHLIVFIRHFFCGHCQEYVRALAEFLPPSTLSSLAPPAKLTVIGHGDPSLIPTYIAQTSCPFAVYADPTRKLYDAQGMTSNLGMGDKDPDYIRRGFLKVLTTSFWGELMAGRKALSGGNWSQNGGEEILDGEGKLVWGRKMLNTRDHAEIKELKQVLGMHEA
ncbi:hypothetical protein LTR50_006732 [Elasticomyces elasticus]|nr:hypothetical protein LTR50_006732 [Elasticomyces elasticus]